MVSANQYEFKEGDEVFGPCTAHDLSDLASNGSLTAAGFVRRIGTDRWIPAAKVKGLTFGQSSPENPTPGTPQSNTPVAHMQNYYVYDSSQQVVGPYSVVEVRQQLEDQTLDLNTRVCLEGTEEWEAIGEVPVLSSGIERRSPAPKISPPLSSGVDELMGGPVKVRTALNPIGSFVLSLKNYGKFSGRTRRCDYWWAVAVSCPVTFVGALLLVFLAPQVGNSGGAVEWLFLLLMLALIPWGLALNVRRLHDIGKSGWWIWLWILMGIIPFVNIAVTIWQLVWFCADSERGDNRFGPSPKYL